MPAKVSAIPCPLTLFSITNVAAVAGGGGGFMVADIDAAVFWADLVDDVGDFGTDESDSRFNKCRLRVAPAPR
jgi:hypothetical protein